MYSWWWWKQDQNNPSGIIVFLPWIHSLILFFNFYNESAYFRLCVVELDTRSYACRNSDSYHDFQKHRGEVLSAKGWGNTLAQKLRYYFTLTLLHLIRYYFLNFRSYLLTDFFSPFHLSDCPRRGERIRKSKTQQQWGAGNVFTGTAVLKGLFPTTL